MAAKENTKAETEREGEALKILALEAGDEFEDFPACDTAWNSNGKDEEPLAQYWVSEWEDDDESDDFIEAALRQFKEQAN